MPAKYILSEYVEQAMSAALYDNLKDGTFTGKIPSCKGAIAGLLCMNANKNCVQHLKIGYW
jgi:hypothetical protein